VKQGAARDVGVVIVAAGRSTRTAQAEPKQFRWIAGKPMLLHSVQAFLSRADVCAVVCVLPRQYVADPPPWIFQSDIERLLLSVGGDERRDSVRNGLEDLASGARIVLVHDAARPFVSQDVVDRVIVEARAGRCAVPALPVVDTLKEVDPDRRIVRTVDRTHLWRAQTPQAFPREVIERAHEIAERNRTQATDDASLAELIGADVVVVRGDERALKITEESDFARAELIAFSE
jgi:2-C-methyl-D-erythritol 4-phosphate cytidylyltransferase